MQELTHDGRTPRNRSRSARPRCANSRRAGGCATARAAGVSRCEHKGLFRAADSLAEEAAIREYYLRNIFPLMTPQSIDPAHPFPFISNLSLNLLVTLRDSDDIEPSLARVKVPVGLGIPVFCGLREADRFVPLEDVVRTTLDLLFPEGEDRWPRDSSGSPATPTPKRTRTRPTTCWR